ncbi:MAG TPA: ATP-binding protein [Ohtaekwangia sp.]
MRTDSENDLLAEIRRLQSQLDEANDTLDAIRTGQVDALVVNGHNGHGHTLFTLKTADHAYRIFIEQMTEGAVTLNSSGLIIYSNSQFASMVKVPLSNVLAEDFSTFVTDDCKETFDRYFHTGWKESVKGELSIRSGDLIVPVLLSLYKLELEEEVALSIIVTDLSSQKETERELTLKNQQLESLNQALINSNHDLQQFASVASHDLQEPLRKIQVFSKFLKDRSTPELSEQSKFYIEKIFSSAQRMRVLIIDILNYSRLSKDDDNIESVSLRNIIDEILEDFDLKISERNARIEIGDLPVVEGNAGQLRQVFYNLIINALKFVSPDRTPHIVISAKPVNFRELGISLTNESEYCCISVVDNGIGFDEKFATSIFNLFEKLNPKSTFEGSGIGLAIAKKIVDKHHGLIIAKSEKGIGSEFNIVLPHCHVKRNPNG